MTERKTAEKLPYARKYLRAARWGLDVLLDRKPIGPGYLFHVAGLLATLRACQHVLMDRDWKLSPRHGEVIGAWKQRTKQFKQISELFFIREARNKILKDGSFASYATRTEYSWDTGVADYEMAHYLDGERRDLETDVRAAFDWFERQLAEIEAQLPPRYEDDTPNESDAYAGPISISPQTIAATTTTPGIEDGVVIEFARRPQPWQHGDVIDVFHSPTGRTTLTANEDYSYIYSWTPQYDVTEPFRLDRIDDHHYRVARSTRGAK